METIKKILDYVDSHNLYPDLRIIEGGAEPEVIIDGKKVLMFSSNNYLGLATHPKVVAAARQQRSMAVDQMVLECFLAIYKYIVILN